MTFTINDFFIDSSILIEYNKGTKVRLFSSLMSNDLFRCIINETVVSEFLFHFIAHNGKKSLQAIHSSKQIAGVFNNSRQYKLISVCHFLPSDTRIIPLVPLLMAKYNLLPNDAIILASCKLNHINQLVSHDTDLLSLAKLKGLIY